MFTGCLEEIKKQEGGMSHDLTQRQITLHSKWFSFMAAAVHRGMARRAQQIGYAAEHICVYIHI